MDILLGILLIILGISIALLGIQVFFAILPVLGFIFGFFLGAAGVEAIFGDGFLSTVTGWIVGAVVGILFASIAWFWWYAGVVVSAWAAGMVLATGLAEAIGISSGILLFLFGIVGGIGLMILTIGLDVPIYVVIFNTAITGASILIAGAMLLFNRLDYEQMGDGTAVVIVNASWWWVFAWFIVVVLGIGRQLTVRDSIQMPLQRWSRATAGGAAS